jgi:hypothetical protein
MKFTTLIVAVLSLLSISAYYVFGDYPSSKVRVTELQRKCNQLASAQEEYRYGRGTLTQVNFRRSAAMISCAGCKSNKNKEPAFYSFKFESDSGKRFEVLLSGVVSTLKPIQGSFKVGVEYEFCGAPERSGNRQLINDYKLIKKV